MSAARKFAPDPPSYASRSGAIDRVAAGQLAGRDSISRPAFSPHARPSDNGQYAENEMGKSTRANTVNSRNNTVKSRFRPYVVAATKGVVKEVARETTIAPRTIEDLRCHERLGSAETFLLLARRDRRLAAEVKRFLDEGIIRQSLGPVAEYFPDAIDKIMRGK